MPRRKAPSYVVVRGVRYVPESPDAETRRKDEREERVILKRISKTVALGIAKSGLSKPKAERDPSLYHHVMMLTGGLNRFEFEGSLVLPPKRIETAEGKGAMVVFIVGRQPVRGRTPSARPVKTLIYANAYGDLATDLLARYRWKDHIRVWGILTSMTKYGRPITALAVQRVELVERHPENAYLDDAGSGVLDRAMPGTAVAGILDAALAAPAE